jgi:hypothetical protein
MKFTTLFVSVASVLIWLGVSCSSGDTASEIVQTVFENGKPTSDELDRVVKLGPAAVPPLVDRLLIVKHDEVLPVIMTLTKLPRSAIEEHLLPVLKDANAQSRLRAIQAIGHIFDPDDIAAEVSPLLNDPVLDVRIAAFSLGVDPTKRGYEAVYKSSLHSPHEMIRFFAARALSRKGDPEALTALTELVGSDSPIVKRGSISAIGKYGGLGIRLLKGVRKESDEETQRLIDEEIAYWNLSQRTR